MPKSLTIFHMSNFSIPVFGTQSLRSGLISSRNAIRWRKIGPIAMPGSKVTSAPACSKSPLLRMPASPAALNGIGAGSLTRAKISHRSSPSNVTLSFSSPIGPTAALGTSKLSGSLAAAVAVPGRTTIGWADVVPPNCSGSATCSANREDRRSASSDGFCASPVIFRPFSRAPDPSSTPDSCAPPTRRQANEPSTSSTAVPLTGTMTDAPLLAIRGAGAPGSSGSSSVTVRPAAGMIEMPLTVTGRSEYQRTILWRRTTSWPSSSS
jgi:hypothetical protein